VVFYVFLLIAVFFFWAGWGKTSLLVFAFIYLIFLILVFSLSILRAGLSSKNRNFFLPVKYVFTDEIVTLTSPISTEMIKWEAFIKWKGISKYYLLYLSNLLNGEVFTSLTEAKVLIEQWRREYNQVRPHSSLDTGLQVLGLF
jgi:transposase InsO family protein